MLRRAGVLRACVALASLGTALAIVSAACGGGSGVDTASQFGKPCTCNLEAATPGDYMCSSTSGPCSGENVCVNGTCTRLCSLDDAGAQSACPDGSTCKRTPKSNLAVYCALD